MNLALRRTAFDANHVLSRPTAEPSDGCKDTSPSGGIVPPLNSPGGRIHTGICYRPTEYFVNAPPAWASEFGPSAA
jgi:hypothetical protein